MSRRSFPVSWFEIHRDARALAWRLSEKGEWKGMLAVTKGGMVPACIVAKELKIGNIQTLCISTYAGRDEQSDTHKIYYAPELENGGEGWLIVDDLVDTGNTFRIAREMYPNAHFAAVYAKPEGLDTTDSYVTEVSQDTWIDFPWEGDPQK